MINPSPVTTYPHIKSWEEKTYAKKPNMNAQNAESNTLIIQNPAFVFCSQNKIPTKTIAITTESAGCIFHS